MKKTIIFDFIYCELPIITTSKSFKTNNDRTKFFKKLSIVKKCFKGPHSSDDLVVEAVIKESKNVETWIIGS